MMSEEQMEALNAPQEQKAKPYTVRRKIIWKGKFAPKRMIYIVVDVATGKSKYTAVQLVLTGYEDQEEYEALVAEDLYAQIKEKYKL